jgi:CDP-diacylglycerol--glycerol-3-phosphate 3-phosphatidyltransferase
MGPLDALDGAVARAKGETKPFGAFLDSVTDRYSELVVFLGLLIHFLRIENSSAVIVTFVAAAGSILVSYTRARAEGVGYQVKAGLMTRVERYLVLVPGIIFGFPTISLWIIAILANITAIQRIWIVWKYSQEEEKEN